MHHKAILEAGLAVEAGKQTIITSYRKVAHKAYTWTVEWDKAHPVIIPCSGDFLCDKQGRGIHKHSCPHSKHYTCACWMCKGEREPVIQGAW